MRYLILQYVPNLNEIEIINNIWYKDIKLTILDSNSRCDVINYINNQYINMLICNHKLYRLFKNYKLRNALSRIMNHHSQTMCIICLTDLIAPIKCLVCFHKFHDKCINDWLCVKPICPICNNKNL